MEYQKPDNPPRPGPDVVEKKTVAKERAAPRVGSCIVQSDMRSVLDQMTTRGL